MKYARQLFVFFGCAQAAIIGFIGATCSMLCYGIISQIAARSMPRVVQFFPSPEWAQIFFASLCFVPILLIDSWRAARALGPKDSPLGLQFASFGALATPLWLPYAVDEFGPYAQLAAAFWWPIGCLTPVAFVVAAAQIDAENRGEKVRVAALNTVYHLGGFIGVALARRTFPGSKAAEEFPSGAPKGVLGVAAFVGVFLLTRIAPVLGVTP